MVFPRSLKVFFLGAMEVDVEVWIGIREAMDAVETFDFKQQWRRSQWGRIAAQVLDKKTLGSGYRSQSNPDAVSNSWRGLMEPVDIVKINSDFLRATFKSDCTGIKSSILVEMMF